ncbi:zincin-like metallopeptidase domain-containing protein [Novispirillum itersonii]|uniref:Antirestriction protein ArdC/phage/plasmid primase-like uncharacterized protein n=1 Tax=Novispirillum itersonii TaxID=189 RepID=A0A7X0DQP4_NOVIT|nr:zincin-like metallopeptidase domain-containing protein [Novispirillum itersonii]MBB6212492.1 antirestriction protein ArdC/phage/plasmid primase-like uncharacterized protein [Novispirillum itersonii]
MADTPEKIPFRDRVVAEMLRHIEAGTAPWQKPWKPGEYREQPMNPTTGKPYRGMNAVWLETHGYADPRWMTYKQAQSVGAQVRKGERGCQIEYWQRSETKPLLDASGKPVLAEDGRPKTTSYELERPRVFRATVFNGSQIEGLEPHRPKTMDPAFQPLAEAEKLLAAGGVEIRHDQHDRAFYRPGSDRIHLPPRETFRGAEEYYATALHELAHATGHPSRLARDMSGGFGSENYAREELRAEMAAYMVNTSLGLGHNPERHAAYVGSWLSALKDDRNLLFQAARDAETIQTWITQPDLRPELRQAVEARISMDQNQKQETGLTQTPEQGSSKTLTAAFDPVVPAGTEVIYTDRNGLFGAADVTKDTPVSDIQRQMRPRDFTLYGVGGTVLEAYLRERAAELQKEPALSPVVQTEPGQRIWLAVPFKEKDMAKKAGARWDAKAKAWYAPPGINPEGLAQWLPKADQPRRQPDGIDPMAEFAAAAAAHGLKIDGLPQMDGQWHRVPLHDDRGKDLNGAYKAHLDGRPSGLIRNYKTMGEPEKWIATGHRLDPAELEQLKADSRAREAREKQELDARQAGKARLAADLLMRGKPLEGSHPYLERKQVQAHGLKRHEDGSLMVPCRDANGEVWNIQFIKDDGEKRFLKDGKMDGLMHRIEGNRGGPTVIAEGYATAATLHEATGLPVVVAYNSGNLPKVAEALQKQDPGLRLVIAADDDAGTALKYGKNPGLEAAQKAATLTGAKVAVPPFTQAERQQGLTDWNDFAAVRGKEAVTPALRQALGLGAQQDKTLKQDQSQNRTQQPARRSGIGLSLGL